MSKRAKNRNIWDKGGKVTDDLELEWIKEHNWKGIICIIFY